MDIVDRELATAEREATRRYSGESVQRLKRRENERRASAEAAALARAQTQDSNISSSTDSSSDHEGDMGRIATATGASIVRTRTTRTDPIEFSRIQTHRLQHSVTVGASLRSRTKTNSEPLPNFGGGKPYPPPLPPYDEFVVEYDGPNDPLHPQNWKMSKKIFVGVILAYTSFCSTFTSSLFSASTTHVAQVFGVGLVVSTLSTSLYVLGYAFGPLVWGPFSELQGRKMPILVGMFGFTVFNFGTATAENLQTLMICRFFTGFFGSCPLAVVAAVFADIFTNTQRGTAVVVFATTVFLGPMMGPFLGGFIEVNPHMGWRWNLYIPGILGGLAFALNALFLPESYAPVVLVEKAADLRRRTKNWGIHAKQEEIEVDLKELVTKNLTRPLRLLISEPIILLIAVYMSFIYGLLYLFLTAYPLVFAGVHGFKPGISGLPFFGMVIGIIIVATYIIWESRNYNKKLAANGGIPIPEWRLPPVILGGVLFTIGLFWFGWTGYKKDIHWIVPTLSGLCTGFGLLAIFIQLFNYIIDSYLMFAASAIASNTFLRSITAAGFPLFARQMFEGMGIEWAATLLGCLSAAMVPIPVYFYLNGKKLRAKSKFAPSMKAKPHDDSDSDEPTSPDLHSTSLDDSGETNHNMVALHATRTRRVSDIERTQTNRSTTTREMTDSNRGQNKTTVAQANAAYQANADGGDSDGEKKVL